MNEQIQQYFATTWRLRRLMAGRFQAASQTVGLSQSQSEVIITLLKSGGSLTAKDLADVLRLTPGAVSQQLDSLERLGCITRVRNPSDRRSTDVCVNEADAKVLHLRAFIADLTNEIATGLDHQELDHLLQIQQKIVTILTPQESTK